MFDNNARIPPGQVNEALQHIRQGGRLLVLNVFRCVVLDKRALSRSEKSGAKMLTQQGKGFRLQMGKASVYVLPGQLRAVA